MNKFLTIIIYLLTILIPLYLILNFKTNKKTSISKEEIHNDSITNIVDSVLLKIELNKKHEQELTSKLDSTTQLLNSEKTKNKKKPQRVEIVEPLLIYTPVVATESEIRLVEIQSEDSDCLEELEFLKEELNKINSEIVRLEYENTLLKDTLYSLKETNIWKKVLKKIQ